MPAIYNTQAEVPEAERADHVEHGGKWKHKDLVAALNEADRVKGINAGLITEKQTAEQQAAAEKTRADNAEAAARTGKTVEELENYAKGKLAPVETERDTFKTKAEEAQAKLDRNELEKLVRKHQKEANLLSERLDDDLIMNALLENTKYENKQAVVLDAEGKPTATPFLDHLKRFDGSNANVPAKKYIYAFNGGEGGGMQHGDPAAPAGKESPDTADKAVAQVNAQNAARPNPLAPKTAAK